MSEMNVKAPETTLLYLIDCRVNDRDGFHAKVTAIEVRETPKLYKTMTRFVSNYNKSDLDKIKVGGAQPSRVWYTAMTVSKPAVQRLIEEMRKMIYDDLRHMRDLIDQNLTHMDQTAGVEYDV